MEDYKSGRGMVHLPFSSFAQKEDRRSIGASALFELTLTETQTTYYLDSDRLNSLPFDQTLTKQQPLPLSPKAKDPAISPNFQMWLAALYGL